MFARFVNANDEYYTDCLARRDCEADWETRVLDRTEDVLVLYSYWTRTPSCTSIPHLALDYFGDGLVFETTWTGRPYEWRIIAPGETAFHDVRFNSTRVRLKPSPPPT